MHPGLFPPALLFFLAAAHALAPSNAAKPIPRSLDAVLEPREPAPTSPAHPWLKYLAIRQAVMPAQAPAVAAPAPAAPVAGVGGGVGAPAPQPKAGDAATPIVITSTTVVDGATQLIVKTITQATAGPGSAPSVMSGAIGLGTLTGKIGVVKTGNAKSDAVSAKRLVGVHELVVILLTGMFMFVGGGIFGIAAL